MAKRLTRAVIGGLAVLAATLSAPAGARPVDIELVIAVDSSTSVDFDEFNLQVRGLAAAFRDPTVVAAIADGPTARFRSRCSNGPTPRARYWRCRGP